MSEILMTVDKQLLAKHIAKRLFTNGQGQHADRLLLELPGKSYGGGWCEQAVADQIERALTEEENNW